MNKAKGGTGEAFNHYGSGHTNLSHQL